MENVHCACKTQNVQFTEVFYKTNISIFGYSFSFFLLNFQEENDFGKINDSYWKCRFVNLNFERKWKLNRNNTATNCCRWTQISVEKIIYCFLSIVIECQEKSVNRKGPNSNKIWMQKWKVFNLWRKMLNGTLPIVSIQYLIHLFRSIPYGMSTDYHRGEIKEHKYGNYCIEIFE